MINQENKTSTYRQIRTTSFWFGVIALAAVFFADIDIVSTSPWGELSKMGKGLLTPKVISWTELLEAIATTLAFALEGMLLAVIAGFIFSLGYRYWCVRALCALLRAIHEIFWALIFIQIFGLSPLTGVLALAIPYAGTLAKIYGELFEESSQTPQSTLVNPRQWSAFLYTTLPLCWAPLQTYTSYRLECAIRSSIVLGFIGLPTLGYHLESTLQEGLYSEASALLYTLIAIIFSLKFFLYKRLLPVYILFAFWYLPPSADININFIIRFLTVDIIPAPLVASWQADSSEALCQWLLQLWQQQMLPGLINTFMLTQISLVSTAIFALLALPINSPHFTNFYTRFIGDSLLIIIRTIPEFILAFILLILVGPSILPGVIALTLHNSAILAHLLGHFSETLTLRDDASSGLNRYAYEIIPRVYRHFLALLLYRWEVIMRESAILGILGIATLGFYIDSAFEEFRFDRAALLIFLSALLNIAVDSFSRYLRKRLHLSTTPETF